MLTLVEVALGSGNARVGNCRYYLAECYRCEGKLDEAAVLYRRSLDLLTDRMGPDHHLIADNYYNLARVYEEQGRLREAIPPYERAIVVWDKNPRFGPDTPLTAKVMNRMAYVHVRLGEFA